MLHYSITEADGILRVSPSGTLTVQDFAGLTHFADVYLKLHGTLEGVLIEAKSFPGWDNFAALCAHLHFHRDQQQRISRIALVTDNPVAHLVELLAEPFRAAEIRVLPFDQLDGAVRWLRADGARAPRLVIVLTSHGKLGSTDRTTGFWLEELAAPYYVFKDAGARITLASPHGGRPPVDPASEVESAQTDASRRFSGDAPAQAQLAATVPLGTIDAREFDAVFYPGGHGPLWDLAEDRESIALIEAMYAAGKPVAAVCHAPGVFRHVKAASGGPLVRGRAVTGFSDSEEAAVGLSGVVPFLVEDMLTAAGARYSKRPDWSVHVVTDGLLITGQNPASSGPAAEALLTLLQEKTR